MSDEARQKRRHSLETTPLRRSSLSEAPIIDVQTGTLQKQRNLNRTPSPEEMLSNFGHQPTGGNMKNQRKFDGQAFAANAANLAHTASIVEQMTEEMTKVFSDLSDAFDHLRTLKVTVAEERERFGKAPDEQRIAQIKIYPLDYCQELLEGEMMANQRLNEKNQLLSKRNYDLEQRLGFVETNVERMQKAVIDKAEQMLAVWIARFNAQETSLIAERDAEASNVQELRNSNQIIQVTLTNLEQTKERNIAEIAQLNRDLAQKSDNLKQLGIQNKDLENQLENLKRIESDLRRRLQDTEENLRRSQEENRTLTRDFNNCQQENNRLDKQRNINEEKHRNELQSYRDEMQKTWASFKDRLDNEHRQKLSQNEREIQNLQRALDDTKRDLSLAQAKVRELELSREDYEHRVRDELQRTVMAKYRDMVLEIAPERPIPPPAFSIPPRYRSTSISGPGPSASNKENEARFGDRPTLGNKKEQLTQVLSKAIARSNIRR